jgi:hypothetical protein
MNSLNELRKELKAIGYNVRTKTYSWGQSVRYFQISDGRELPTIFTKESLEHWQPLLKFLRDNTARLKELNKRTKIYGLTP